MEGMFSYTQAAMERTMKVQEVILRALAKKITWWQAAEIIGISDRQMRRWHERYEEFGFRGLFDRRRGKPSPKKVPLAVVEKVLGLYREKYFDLNVRHFHIRDDSVFYCYFTSFSNTGTSRSMMCSSCANDLSNSSDSSSNTACS
jgi:hypothetical protein